MNKVTIVNDSMKSGNKILKLLHSTPLRKFSMSTLMHLLQCPSLWTIVMMTHLPPFMHVLTKWWDIHGLSRWHDKNSLLNQYRQRHRDTHSDAHTLTHKHTHASLNVLWDAILMTYTFNVHIRHPHTNSHSTHEHAHAHTFTYLP